MGGALHAAAPGALGRTCRVQATLLEQLAMLQQRHASRATVLMSPSSCSVKLCLATAHLITSQVALSADDCVPIICRM